MDYNDFKRYLQEEHLKDIAFEMEQGARIIALISRYNFTPVGKLLNNSLSLIRKNKEDLIDNYKKTYGKDPDIALAKQLFIKNKAIAYGQRQGAGA